MPLWFVHELSEGIPQWLERSVSLQSIMWTNPKNDSNYQQSKNNFTQTESHSWLWDRVTHWLYNSITLRCFCTFHAWRSQRSYWAATEGIPFIKVQQSLQGSAAQVERAHRGEAGESVQKQNKQRGREVPHGSSTSDSSSLKVCSETCAVSYCTCSGELCRAWCCSTWDICTPPVPVWAAGFQWILWLRSL